MPYQDPECPADCAADATRSTKHGHGHGRHFRLLWLTISAVNQRQRQASAAAAAAASASQRNGTWLWSGEKYTLRGCYGYGFGYGQGCADLAKGLLIRDICFCSVRVVPPPLLSPASSSSFSRHQFHLFVIICFARFQMRLLSTLPSPHPALSLALLCYYSANIKDAAAHWVTQSAACQAAGHEVTQQLIWQVPCRPGTSPSNAHPTFSSFLLLLSFPSLTHDKKKTKRKTEKTTNAI